jgi:thymidylate synthase (FAD)
MKGLKLSKVSLVCYSVPAPGLVEKGIKDAQDLLAYMARVSNPDNQYATESGPKLLKYLIKNKHWSPLEMVHLSLEIETTRDIARQVLRHRSFSFQEFSQRYAAVQGFELSEVRLQDVRNRQNSIEVGDSDMHHWWFQAQKRVRDDAELMYNMALAKGVAKEQARKLLPEGLTMSRMYMAGNLRSWLHYVDIRCDKATQKEHREVAEQVKLIVCEQFPAVKELFYAQELNNAY